MPANQQNNKRSSWLPYVLLAIIASIGGAVLSLSNQQPTPPPELATATLLTPGKSINPSGLVDHDGKAFGLEQLQGFYTFIFFGYTHCPDICPATLYQFKTMAKTLKSQQPELFARTRFMLASIDPQRDTPQHLKDYVQYYDPAFIGITGSVDDIKIFSRQMGVIFERRENEDETEKNKDNNDYLVDHSSAILMVNPEGHLKAVFSAPHNATEILKDYQSIFNYLEHK